MHIEFGSNLDTNSNNDFLLKNHTNINWFDNIYTFQNCRSALNLIARISKRAGYKKIFIPAICCHSMVQPFKFNDFDIIFYPLNKDFSIDQNYINSKISPKSIILYANYLGLKTIDAIRSDQDYLSNLKSDYIDLKLIQDCTQSLNEIIYKENLYADYYICSVRKWASFPDGGILFSNVHLDFTYDNYDNTVFNLKKKAMDLKSEFLLSGNQNKKNEFLKLFKQAEEIIDVKNSIIDMSSYSKELLLKIDFDLILKQRQENIKYIQNYLNSFIPNFLGSGLYFPIYVDNQKLMQSELAKKNIYCPVIWPLSDDIKEDFGFVKEVTSHMLAVPCDQRYNKEDLDYIISSILECLKTTNSKLSNLE